MASQPSRNASDSAARERFEAHKADLGFGLLLKKYVSDFGQVTPALIDRAMHDTVPRVAPLFWSFRLMVALGFAMLLVFGLALWHSVKGDFADKPWLLRAALLSLPMPWIACEVGWFVAEYGRQPWTIYGVLPTHLSVSTLTVNSLYGSLAGFVGFALPAASLITILAAIGGVLLIGVMGFTLGRSIARPLRAMQQAITRTATELDFTDSIAVRSHDEVGHTLDAYNKLLARLRDSFSEIQAAAARMTEITESVNKTAAEIAENSHAQSDASASMAAAIEQLTVSISMVANQAHEASLHTQESRDKADRGAEVIYSTVSGIQTISESVRQTSGRIDALRVDSEQISSVVQVISEVAEINGYASQLADVNACNEEGLRVSQ